MVALQMSFSLPSSTYATMLLREVMKTSTSASFHRNAEIAAEASAEGAGTATKPEATETDTESAEGAPVEEAAEPAAAAAP